MSASTQHSSRNSILGASVISTMMVYGVVWLESITVHPLCFCSIATFCTDRWLLQRWKMRSIWYTTSSSPLIHPTMVQSNSPFHPSGSHAWPGLIQYSEFKRFFAGAEQELWRIFKSVDLDGNGKIDRKELQLALSRGGIVINPPERLEEFFLSIDRDHDGGMITDRSELKVWTAN